LRFDLNGKPVLKATPSHRFDSPTCFRRGFLWFDGYQPKLQCRSSLAVVDLAELSTALTAGQTFPERSVEMETYGALGRCS
jgi:hypothetical protein